jgi:hypothetical protein
MKARTAKWRTDNSDLVKAQSVRATERYRSDPKYREHRLALAKKWDAENPEARAASQTRKWHKHKPKLQAYNKKWREDNAEELAAKKLEWERKDKRRNPGKYSAKAAETRAKRLHRYVPWADKDAINFFYECRPDGCHVDHIIPLQGKVISGLHVPENLQWMPARDNQSKSNSFVA